MTKEEKEKAITLITDKKRQKDIKRILLITKNVDEYLEDAENLSMELKYSDDKKMDIAFKIAEKIAIINFLLDKDE